MPRPAAPAALLARATSLGGLTCLAAVTLAHPSATRMQTWPWALLAALLWLLPIAALIRTLVVDRVWRLPHAAITAGLSVLAVGTVLSAWSSPFSSMSLARVWPALGGTAFFFWLHHWLTAPGNSPTERAALAARMIAVMGAALVIVSLVAWGRDAIHISWSVRNAVPFGHSNYVAGCLVLLLPWLVLQTYRSSGVGRMGWGLVMAGALLALLATSSRGGVAAVVAAAGLALVCVLAFSRWSRVRKFSLVGAALLAGVLVFLANPRLRDLALGRGWSDAARESNVQRTAMLEAGLIMGRERPLLGWGPGSVPLTYPRVRARLEGGVDNVLQLHNTPAQLWATLGVAGIAAMALLVLGAGYAAIRMRHLAPSPTGLAAGCSLAGYAVFALTDHQLDLPIMVALVASGLALLTAVGSSRSWQPVAGAWIALAAGMILLLGGPIAALGRDLLARRLYDRGLDAREAGDTAAFGSNLENATRLTPGDPYFQHQIAGGWYEAALTTHDPAERQRLTRGAVAALEMSLGSHAHEEFAHFNLGWLLLDLGQPDAAARHFAAAARLAPDRGGVYFGLGLALQTAGRNEDAVRAFALEWIDDPRQLTSPAWEIPALAALRPAVRAETMRLYAELSRNYPPAATAAAWTRWWLGEPMAPAQTEPDFTREAALFASAWSMEGAGASPTGFGNGSLAQNYTWARVYTAWRNRNFQTVADRSPDFAAALARRAARHPDNFQAFLTAGTEDEPALLLTSRRQRSGYGVLALHPDGPVLNDVYLVQQNRAIEDFAAGLFPPKGWLPGRFLLALLPPDAR